MEIGKYKTIFTIDFPVFTITKNYKNIWTKDKITYIETESGVYVLDNKNMQGDTLGQRRLRLKSFDMYIPRKVIHSVTQLIKSKHRTFIDNNGIVFKYLKQTLVPLKYYEVSKVVNKPKIGCILYFKDIDNPIIVPCKQAYGINYVGFLITKIGYILYEYSEEIKGDTWRKI